MFNIVSVEHFTFISCNVLPNTSDLNKNKKESFPSLCLLYKLVSFETFLFKIG